MRDQGEGGKKNNTKAPNCIATPELKEIGSALKKRNPCGNLCS